MEGTCYSIIINFFWWRLTASSPSSNYLFSAECFHNSPRSWLHPGHTHRLFPASELLEEWPDVPCFGVGNCKILLVTLAESVKSPMGSLNMGKSPHVNIYGLWNVKYLPQLLGIINWNGFVLEWTHILVSPTSIYSFKTSSMREQGVPMRKIELCFEAGIWFILLISPSVFPDIFKSGHMRVESPPFSAVVLHCTVWHSRLEHLSKNTWSSPRLNGWASS